MNSYVWTDFSSFKLFDFRMNSTFSLYFWRRTSSIISKICNYLFIEPLATSKANKVLLFESDIETIPLCSLIIS